MTEEKSPFQLSYRIIGAHQKEKKVIDISKIIDFKSIFDFLQNDSSITDLCFIDKTKNYEKKINEKTDFKEIINSYINYFSELEDVSRDDGKPMGYSEIKGMATNAPVTKIKPYDVYVDINGKHTLTLEVYTDSQIHAEEMANDILTNSRFRSVIDSSKKSVDLNLRIKSKKELER